MREIQNVIFVTIGNFSNFQKPPARHRSTTLPSTTIYHIRRLLIALLVVYPICLWYVRKTTRVLNQLLLHQRFTGGTYGLHCLCTVVHERTPSNV
jgi:hypothetical protein